MLELHSSNAVMIMLQRHFIAHSMPLKTTRDVRRKAGKQIKMI